MNEIEGWAELMQYAKENWKLDDGEMLALRNYLLTITQAVREDKSPRSLCNCEPGKWCNVTCNI